MRNRIAIYIIALALFLVLTGCASSVPQMEIDKDALVKKILENIKNAPKGEKPKWDVNYSPTPHDKSVCWQVLASNLLLNDIAGLRLVSPDRLLLSVEEANPRLIDTENGNTVWELTTLMQGEIEKDKKATSAKYPSYACITVYRDLIVFRADGNDGSKILAVEKATGNKRWAAELKKSGELNLIPLPEVGVLLVVQQDKRYATLTAFNLSTGAIAWQSESGYGSGTVEPPLPTAGDDAIWLFYDGVTRLSAANGKTQWSQPEILAGNQSPPMRLEEGRLNLLDGKNTLYVLDASSGKTLASGKQREAVVYTNIFPIRDRVYLRGVEKGKSEEPLFLVAAVRSSDGKEIWGYTDNDISVSNLIDEDGCLYFSTPFTVIALNRETGTRRFAVRASDIGKSFPVHIEHYGNRIVYVGELVIAAFDAKTGAKIYRHGFDPVNQTAHMDALNEAIEVTHQALSWFTGPLSEWKLDLKGAGMSKSFFAQTINSQNQSNYHHEMAEKYHQEYRSTGDRSKFYESRIHMGTSTIDSAFANAQLSIGMSFAMLESLQRATEAVTATDRARLQKLLLTRRLLYAAYVITQQGEYVYRPVKGSDGFGISLIHLPSGRASYTEMEWGFVGQLGIYCLVDTKKGVVYHAGWRQKPKKAVYFIARPVTVPK